MTEKTDLHQPVMIIAHQDMIYILSPDGQILDINPPGIQLMGLSSIEDAQPRSIIDFTVDPATGKALVKEIRDPYWRLKKVSDGHGASFTREPPGRAKARGRPGPRAERGCSEKWPDHRSFLALHCKKEHIINE